MELRRDAGVCSACCPPPRRIRSICIVAPITARPQATKKLLREDFAREWGQYWEGEAAWGWQLLSSPSTVSKLGAVLERLSGKKARL